MTNYPEQFFTALRSVFLSERERANIRIEIQTYMREHPLAVKLPLHMRFANWAFRSRDSINRFLDSRAISTHPAFAACVLVLCIGIGTSYAASNALPGEPLYSFKTRVNEPVLGAIALTPVAKAQWSAELANRRLQEAEVLAASGKLTPVTSAAIVTGIDSAVADFDSNVAVLAKRSNDTEAADAQSDLEASFNAHETVLATLTKSANDDVGPIVTMVREHAEHISHGRYAAEVSIAAKNDPTIQKTAMKIKKDAQTEMKQAALFSEASTNMAIASSVSAISEEAQNDIRDGDMEAKKGKWGKAFGAFQAAVRKLKETQTSIDARARVRATVGANEAASTTAAMSSTTSATTSDAGEKSGKGKKDESDSGNSHDRKDEDESDR